MTSTAIRPTAMEEVMRQIHAVTDPELDEPVTDLGFVESINIDAHDHVRIVFRLPTYWCAANFAFMMAGDIRDRVEELLWVQGVTVELIDHFSAEQINHATAAGASFSTTFSDEAGGELDDLRQLFQSKAFLRRQERLLRYLLAKGHTADELLGLSLAGLAALEISEVDGARLQRQYLAARNKLGNRDPSSPAFVKPNGRPLAIDSLPVYLRELRRVSANTEFNAVLCRSLLKARYNLNR
jgi:metal-sulfur cluster biosynthetic enzyme